MKKYEVDEWMLTGITELEFSTRLVNALRDRDIHRVAQVYGIDLYRMKQWHRVGETTVNELRDWLKDHPDPRYHPDGSLVSWDDDGHPAPLLLRHPIQHEPDRGVQNIPTPRLVTDDAMAEFCAKLSVRRDRLVELIKDAAIIQPGDGGGRRMRHFTSRLGEVDLVIKTAKKAGVWVR